MSQEQPTRYSAQEAYVPGDAAAGGGRQGVFSGGPTAQSVGQGASISSDEQQQYGARQQLYGSGTDVMGNPSKPSFANRQADPPPSYTAATADTTNDPGLANYGAQRGSVNDGSSPHVQNAAAAPGAASHGIPYVQTTAVSPGSAAAKSPMDSIMGVCNKWGKKAEEVTGSMWTHLRTGPNLADTAMGRLAVGRKAWAEGGLEKVFAQTFEVQPEERLLKTYACFLSTSSGPVSGTLYISTHKLAFCSDRPLQTGAAAPPQASRASPAANATQQQQSNMSYYKVTIPLTQLRAVNPVENNEKRPPEKYIQVTTVDGHDFWFMGFVHYDKGLLNLQEALKSRDNAGYNVDPLRSTNNANLQAGDNYPNPNLQAGKASESYPNPNPNLQAGEARDNYSGKASESYPNPNLQAGQARDNYSGPNVQAGQAGHSYSNHNLPGGQARDIQAAQAGDNITYPNLQAGQAGHNNYTNQNLPGGQARENYTNQNLPGGQARDNYTNQNLPGGQARDNYTNQNLPAGHQARDNYTNQNLPAGQARDNYTNQNLAAGQRRDYTNIESGPVRDDLRGPV